MSILVEGSYTYTYIYIYIYIHIQCSMLLSLHIINTAIPCPDLSDSSIVLQLMLICVKRWAIFNLAWHTVRLLLVYIDQQLKTRADGNTRVHCVCSTTTKVGHSSQAVTPSKLVQSHHDIKTDTLFLYGILKCLLWIIYLCTSYIFFINVSSIFNQKHKLYWFEGRIIIPDFYPGNKFRFCGNFVLKCF